MKNEKYIKPVRKIEKNNIPGYSIQRNQKQYL